MAEADYLLAALPDHHILLGQPLKPFSLGHMMILRRMGNVFVSKDFDDEQAFEDLIRGVFVCAHTFEAALIALQDESLGQVLKEWGDALGVFDVVEKYKAFADYINKGSTFPQLWEPGEDLREPGSPFLHRVKLVLVSELGHSESEALNKPFGLALWDYFGFFELKDRIRLVSDSDQADMAEHARLLKEMDSELERIQKEADGD